MLSILIWLCLPAIAQVKVGMTDTAAYFPRLEGRRVAVLANHTAVAVMEPDAAEYTHLVDLLHGRGFNVTAIFSPEHGFRGTADAGEAVRSSVDSRTGIPVRSLYDGNAKRPSDEAMRSFDILVVDMQDVGLRFYTYYISMIRMMEAAADFGQEVIILDRPNPHGDKVDGPVLDMRYKSGIGALPIPVLHGMTMGEIALMAVGEGWCRFCNVSVVPCRNWTRDMEYILPVAPSPNLPTQRSVYLYPSLCLFEGTQLSVGRGTDRPFECFGHPGLSGGFCFTPQSAAGAKEPLFEGVECRGEDLSAMPLAEARGVGLSLRWLLDAYRAMPTGDSFFKPVFEKLIGVGYVRRMIMEGASEDEIRACWQEDVDEFKTLRDKYKLYD